MDPIELHDYVIVPTLDQIGLNQPGASFLLLGTALVESDLRWLRQQSDGPGLGLWQMEPDTHDDLWLWLLDYTRERDLAPAIFRLISAWPPGATQMIGNLYYGAAMARCKYRRRPEPLPVPTDVSALALYWKTHYNTFQPEQTHKYIREQLERFVALFPEEVLSRGTEENRS